MTHLIIIKAGSTLPHVAQQWGDFDTWIAHGLAGDAKAVSPLPIRVLDVCANHDGSLRFPNAADCAGVVISGSHDMVTDHAPWMQHLQQWLQGICHAGVPVLGICFGHQLLAHTLGGQVGPHPQGLELGTVPVSIQADVHTDPLWQAMPPSFEVQVVHYQSVRRLPSECVILAGNAHEPHQAFRWRSHVWGVQFHPEFSHQAMQAYIDHLQQDLGQHGNALARQHTRCLATPESAQLLQQFARHAHALVRRENRLRQAA